MLRSAALLAFGLLWLGCGAADPDPDPPSPPDEPVPPTAPPELSQARVLSRVTYGPDPWSRQRLEDLGIDAFLEEQLHPAFVAEDPELEMRLASYPTLVLGFRELLAQYGGGMALQPNLELSRATLLRQVLSRRQLEQLLTDFWFDHFNVFGLDRLALFGLVPYERDAIRPHVLGRFEDLLLAVAKSPAMLFYLDNWLSAKEGFVFTNGQGQQEERGLNENYARELLELHTVGVDQGYDQDDVIDVARALTGWGFSVDPNLGDPDGFFYWAEAHDEDAKEIMDDLYLPPGQGQQDGLDLIAFLASHPNTARFVCGKLVARFVDEDPPAAAVDTCADTFLDTDGDLREVMRAILYSSEFADPAREGNKVKRPQVFVASLLRAAELAPLLDDTILDFLIFSQLSILGEPPFRAPAPTGVPDASGHWASAGSVISRFNLAELVGGAGLDWGISGGTHEEIVDAIAARVLPGAIEPQTRTATVDLLDALGAVPDPERIDEAAAALLASPDFLRH